MKCGQASAASSDCWDRSERERAQLVTLAMSLAVVTAELGREGRGYSRQGGVHVGKSRTVWGRAAEAQAVCACHDKWLSVRRPLAAVSCCQRAPVWPRPPQGCSFPLFLLFTQRTCSW